MSKKRKRRRPDKLARKIALLERKYARDMQNLKREVIHAVHHLLAEQQEG